jgi:phage gp46-like protein
MPGIDACLTKLDDGLYDLEIDSNGDIKTVDSFDSAIIVSLFAEKRADESEISLPQFRRGWIGNESTPNIEIGSKLWLYSQSRLTEKIKSGIENAARECLLWLVEDNFAVSIDTVKATIITEGVALEIIIRRPNSEVLKRNYTLWDNTAVPCVDMPTYIEVTTEGVLNLFQFLNQPNYAVDVLWRITEAQTIAGIQTGGPWHPDTTITLVNANVIAGTGGAGGRGEQTDPTNTYGGGGGGGASFGIGGLSFNDLGNGDDGDLSTGGSGGSPGSAPVGSTKTAEDGSKGGVGLILGHSISLINNGTITGGAGGGGGGGHVGFDGKAGGSGGDVGQDGNVGVGTIPGDGGDVGNAIETNGHNITYIQTGTIIGAIV